MLAALEGSKLKLSNDAMDVFASARKKDDLTDCLLNALWWLEHKDESV